MARPKRNQKSNTTNNNTTDFDKNGRLKQKSNIVKRITAAKATTNKLGVKSAIAASNGNTSKRTKTSTSTTTTTNTTLEQQEIDTGMQTRSSNRSTSNNQNTNKSLNIESKEPRKRRIASLNAEALLHIYSTPANGASNVQAATIVENTDNTASNDAAKQQQQTDDNEVVSSKRKNGTANKEDENNEVEKEVAVEKKENGDNAAKNNKKEEEDDKEQGEDGDDEDEEDEEEEDEEEEEEQEDVKAKKAKTTAKKKPTKAQAAKTAKAKATAAANKKQRAEDLLKQQQQQQMDAPRPKREASMRASAMIIQTNEIEKTRYNYSSYLNSHHVAAENHNNNNNKNNHENENNTNNRHNSSNTNNNNNNKKAKAKSKTKRVNRKSTANNDDEDDEEEEEEEDDEVDEKIYHNHKNNNKAEPKALSTVIKVKVGELTQENLAEHNRVFAQANAASSGANCSQFSSNTRDYIQKWTNDNSISLDEKPFPVGTIPLETFGAKILNAPQYLLHKSKASSVVSASNSTATTTAAAATPSTPQQQDSKPLHEVPSSVNVIPPNSVINSSHHSHHHSHQHHHHHHHKQIKQESDVVAVNTPAPPTAPLPPTTTQTSSTQQQQKTNNTNLNNYSSHQSNPIINSKSTTSPRQNGAGGNANASPLTANVLAQQQIANLQLATQIEQAQLQAQLQQQQNAAVQNTALNNLAAALNLSMQPQMTSTSPTAAAQAAALFQQNAAFNRPYLPIFSFAPPWQYAAAAAALQPLPDRCIIQPAPVHVFQQPTVNVVVKPQTSGPVMYGHSHKSSHKSQKIDHDELKITLNHPSPSKQGSMMSSFHKSTSAPTIGVTSNSASYQVKIKTEKSHSKASNNYVDPLAAAAAANALPFLGTMPDSLLDQQQLQQFQQQLHSGNFMMPNFSNNQAALNFAKMFQNPNLTKFSPPAKKPQYPSSPAKVPKKSKEETALKKPPVVVHEPVSTTTASVVEEEVKDKDIEIIDEIKPAVRPAVSERAEAMVVDKPLTAEEAHPINDTEITTTTVIINEHNNRDDCSSTCSSSTSSHVLHIDLDCNTNQAQLENPVTEDQLKEEQPMIVATQNEELSTSSSATPSATTTTNTNLALCTNETTIQTATDDLTKARQKFISSSSTITNFYNDEDINDTENSISSFALSLKVNKRLAIPQLWRTCGEPFMKLIAINPNHKPVYRQCYTSIIHEKENETIKVFDCVLLRSSESLSTGTPTTPTTLGRQMSTSSHLITNGADSTSVTPVCDLATPSSTLRTISNSDVFIAKVSSFWRDEITNKIMMELLWYYHPHQTSLKYKTKFDKQELFASKHYDVLDVDCIEDKCYVLTFNEYNRWKTQEKYAVSYNSSLDEQKNLVPKLNEYPRADRQPLTSTASENVFFCRHIYDFRTKRLVKYTQ